MKTHVAWLRVFVEGVVIVGSILMAFGIDAWWDARQERSRERAALLALARDFAAAADALERQFLVMDSVTLAAETILEWTGPEADSRYADSLAVLLPAVSRLPGFRPPLGTLEALLGSGDLGLVRSDSLRAALASFPSRLEGMQRTEAFGSEMLFGEFQPLLNRSIPMRRFGRGGDGATRFDSDVEGMLRSMEFENQLQGRLTNIGFLRGAATSMRDFISEVRAMLDSELTRFDPPAA